ncbi:MAG: sigma-70 family RNA polymerase sigma factor, partial [Planctomycetota bacterium]
SIRSNVAAWLHACASKTAIDSIRRSAVRRRIEAAAAASVGAAETPKLLWSDMEPLIDAALLELRDDDRELIVARFLVGRSQAELARELRVSEGTISRRLKKALAALREHLGSSGLAVAGTGTLASALAAGTAKATTTPALAAVAKIGLSGATRSSGASAGAKPATIAIAAIVGTAGLITGAAAIANLGAVGSSSSSLPAARPAVADLGPARPARAIGPFVTLSTSEETFDQRGLWLTDRGMSIRHGLLPGTGESIVANLGISRIDAVPDNPKTRDVEERAELRASVIQLLPLGDYPTRFDDKKRLTISAGFDSAGRLVLRDVDGEIQLGKNEPTWYGVRPPLGWPEFAKIPDDAGPFGIRGPWTEAERIPVTITDREIRFGTESWSAARYAIIDWQRLEGHSRVLGIHAGGRDPRLISTRFKLLLRQDDDGYTIAYFPPGSARSDDWPASFEFSAKNPVRVVNFADKKP